MTDPVAAARHAVDAVHTQLELLDTLLDMLLDTSWTGHAVLSDTLDDLAAAVAALEDVFGVGTGAAIGGDHAIVEAASTPAG